MKLGAVMMSLLGAGLVPATTWAQAGGASVSDACQVADPLTFDVRSVKIDLSAESTLGESANWVKAEEGRYLLVIGPSPSESSLGTSRAQASAYYLMSLAVEPRLVAITTTASLVGGDRALFAGPDDSILVLRCVGVPPQFVPPPGIGYPLPQ